ncbi:hypothetical protein Lal_00030252 [Lupinus albus]|nr:hypothetical protein Lal_00030252 [Lupinus albus]
MTLMKYSMTTMVFSLTIDKKKVQYNLKAKNILTSALGIDEFFRVSNYKSAKAKVDKYDSSGDESEKEEMEDMNLLVRKFSKFLQRNKGAKTGQMKRFTKNNEASTSNQNFTCFECGKLGHMKMECPNLKKNPFKGKKEINIG